MTIVNSNKIQQVKINKDDLSKATFSIIDSAFNTFWVNIKGEHLAKLKLKTFEELEGKNIKFVGFKSGNFITIDSDKPFSILESGDEYGAIVEAIDNVLVLKVEQNKNKETIIIVKTLKNSIMKIKNKNISLSFHSLLTLTNQRINLFDVSIFKTKEGQVFYSLKENGTIKAITNPTK